MSALDSVTRAVSYPLLRIGSHILLLWFISLSVQAQLPLPIRPEQLLSQGAVHYSLGDHAKATRYLYQYVDIAPEHKAARMLLAAAILQSNEQADEPATRASEVLLALPEAVWEQDRQYRALLATAQLAAGDDINGLAQLQRLGAEGKAAVDTHLTLYVPEQAALEQSAVIVDGELLTVVELGPELIPNTLIEVFAALSQQHYGAAVVAIDNLLRQDRRSPLYNHLAGLVHAEHNDFQRAQGFWQDALRYGRPPLLSTYLAMVQAAIYFGEDSQADELLQQAAKQAPENIDVKLAQADYWIQTDAVERAQALLIEIWAATKPRDVGVKLIELALQQGQYEVALVHAEALEARYPDWSESLLNLGITLLVNGHLGPAQQRFQQLAQQQPLSAQPWYLMATVSVRAQDYIAAFQSLEQAIALEPDYLPARLLRAEIYLLSESYQEALSEARAVQTLAAQQGVGYKLEGDIQIAQGDFSAAVKAYEQAHEKSPSMQTALLLNHAQQLSGAQDDAMTTLRNWLTIASDAVSVRLQLAMQLEQAGQYPDAIQEYYRALDAEPNNLIALNNLAWLLREQAPEQALVLAEQALSLGAERPEILDTMGWLLVTSGQEDRGLRLLQQAAMLAPHLPLIRYHQALAYERTQRYAEALSILAEIGDDAIDTALREQIEQLHERLQGQAHQDD